MKIQDLLIETVDPDVLNPEYHKEANKVTNKDFPIKLVALSSGEFVRVEARVDGKRIATGDFDVGKGYLVAKSITVNPQFQGKGIATAIYDWLEELGNNVKPSPGQTIAGQGFWADRLKKRKPTGFLSKWFSRKNQ